MTQHAHKHSTHCNQACPHDHEHHHHGHDNHWRKAAIGLLWGGSLLILTLLGAGLPLAYTLAIQSLTSLVTFYLGFQVYKAAWQDLKAKKASTASLYTISTLTILAVSTLGLFLPGLPAILEAAPLVLGFWHLGEAIEHSLIHRINKKIDVRDSLPKKVSLKATPRDFVNVKSLKVGDEMVLANGQVLPVDGILLKDTQLFTNRIDGSPHLRLFKKGEKVLSGMQLAESGYTEIRVTKAYKDSYLSLIAKHIDEALLKKAPVELMTDKILKYFVPALITIATLSGVLVATFVNPAAAFECIISVLVSACPCVLSLITPMAVKIGMKKGTEYGVQYKNGASLQASANIDVVVFDLNGTLTQGQLNIAQCHLKKGMQKKLKTFIYHLESQSQHPVAKVICDTFQSQGSITSTPVILSDVDKTHHNGIAAMVEGMPLFIGNRDFIESQQTVPIHPPYDKPENGNIYIAYGNEVVGQIAIHDPLRDDALRTVKALKKLGKEVHICTGADRITAELYGERLDIAQKHIMANMVGVSHHPYEYSKQSYIEMLQRQGLKVAMVGDAANDAVAMTKADLGIAVYSSIGDSITQAQAGIVMQQGNLLPVAAAFDIGQQTTHNIQQNLMVSLTYNSVITLLGAGLFIGLGISLNPIVGVALMVVESSLVLGNIMLLKNQAVLETQTQSTTKLIERLQATETMAPTEEQIKDNQAKHHGFSNPLVQQDVTVTPDKPLQPCLTV